MPNPPPYAVLRERHWERIQNDESVVRVQGMIGQMERKLLWYLTQEYFTGRGEIIDAGSFVGASTVSLANGISKNLAKLDKRRLIHSYDRFVVDADYLKDFLTKHYKTKHMGDSFFDVFSNNMEKYTDYVIVHRGDFLEERWVGKPIEILFIDICKDVRLNAAVMREFFGSLIPGVSVVVHQDYHHPHLPWIHISMESLSAYFEIVAEMVDHSIVFCLREPLPPAALNKCIAYSFNPDEQVSLMDSAIARLKTRNRANVSLAKVILLYQLRGRDAAERELATVIEQHVNSDVILWDMYVDEVKQRLR
jgi:hypothetical protein